MADIENNKNIKYSLEDVAKCLLREHLILTALELHAELTEAGREITSLRDYFSNPSNFELCLKSSSDLLPSANLNRSSSQTTLDSLDWARYSEDAVTQDSGSNNVLGFRKRSNESHNNELKPHEVCTLNFLVNEYLVMRNYKMTANTFADENDNQDYENWDDVGLNIPRPPTLIQWLQEKVPEITPRTETSCQTDISSPKMDTYDNLTVEKVVLEERVKELETLCERQELELQKLERKIASSSHVPSIGSALGKEDIKGEEGSLDIENISDRDKIEIRNSEVKFEKGDHVLDANTKSLNSSSRPEEALTDIRIDTEANMEIHFLSDLSENPNIGSIEDFIENPSSNTDDVVTSSLETLSTRKTLEDFVDEPDVGKLTPIDTPTGVDTPTTEAEFEEEQEDTQELFSESSEVLDPRKCDRLPPLGASSECSPQGVLAGEFISAQREEARNLLRASSTRDVPQFLETQVLDTCFGQTLGVDSRLQNEVAALSLGQCDLLNLVSSSLHNIAPNVILSKREKPDKEQRSTILLGLVSLARVLGPSKLEAELLPQCWEQLSHKHTERRLLVAQSVAVLSPYTPPPLRNSLLLSMLLQLLGSGGEKEPIVREAAMSSLSLLISYLDDVEKVPPLVDTLILCLQRVDRKDESKIKNDSNVTLFLSTFSYWTVKAGCFTQLINPLVEHIKLISHEINAEVKEGNKRNKIEQLTSNLNSLVKGLSAAMPYIFLYLFDALKHGDETSCSSRESTAHISSPNMLSFIDELGVLFGSREKAEKNLYLLHSFVAKNKIEEWKELNYVCTVVLPIILESLTLISVTMKNVVVSFISLISRLCSCLGPQAKHEIICPSFLDILQVNEGDIESVRSGNSNITKAPLVVYVVGILSENKLKDEALEDLQQFLSRHISILSLSRVHQSSLVRAATAPLWILLVGHIKESELSARVIPALVTLATDPDVNVKASVVMPLTFIVANTTSKELKEKVILQLESVCEEAQVLEQPALQVAIAQTCTSLGPNTPVQLLHNLFLPLLCRVALEEGGSPQDKVILQKTLGVMSFDYIDDYSIDQRVYSGRNLLSDRMKTSLSGGGLSSIGSSLSSSMGAMGAGLPIGSGVEDVKNKMSKMFSSTGRSVSSSLQGKGPSINLPTLFKKK
ncbi:LisH domain and HEAT repeat-containing protein [Armadillidium vulgare]|nr:LisH domain and HEAT repeat-containing protein [Armadillidium vulgare]